MTPTIAFLGTGNMGAALLAGILAAGEDHVARDRVHATTKSEESARALAERLDVPATSLESEPDANREAVDGADFVFLGVKPWMMRGTLADLAGALPARAVIVSMAAGFSAAQIQELAPDNPVVRIMPNTPSALGRGVIALAAGEGVDEDQRAQLSALLSGAGEVFEVSEEQIGAMTGISGSGVAYFFYLAEALVAAGVELGLDEETARGMVVQTAVGAGALLADGGDPAALRNAVTSKGGTTHAAITALADADFEAVVARAATAARDRAAEMEAENQQG
ncbi:pyrroline-5-carboxylate reductase [Brevibacterium sp. BRM-1]|uniref:pyrroline-5-carboxylate reductase n=1 Tax=Brevibacterium sp. BRM-1 TaxID=2999062 RepID=UPI002280EBF2|nr:pyrroline-5-carboxylate reductase [Brevibacterium sp. BRM-1]WAL39070.1 pyrroline-5-carboxylate reductase [Brevibacterium sp. BRM-1]